MSRDTHADIALPGVDPQYDLEFHHGGVHIYIGGDMAMLDTAANDPVFFLHHAFVDYIWEMFRMRVNIHVYVYVVNQNLSKDSRCHSCVCSVCVCDLALLATRCSSRTSSSIQAVSQYPTF